MSLDLTKHIAKRIVAETERWCWKAIARGPGHRVWRSDPTYSNGHTYTVTHSFQILAPGEAAPGNGTIFGPFSKR